MKSPKASSANAAAIILPPSAPFAKTAKPKALKKPISLPYPADASKQDRMVALLKRSDGATIDELMNATGWQKHSIRGAISGALKKRMGLAVTSVLEERGRVYRISGDRK